MNYDYFKKKFTEKALVSGYSQENINRCLAYAQPLLEKEIPVIFNTSNLSALVGYKKSYLKRAVFFTDFFYREFKVKKYNGAIRIISEPLPSLKEIQSWVLENILYKCNVSRYAKAYVKDRNIVENVKYHKGQDVVLKLDIQNFFPSIRLPQVVQIFSDLGYSALLSSLLAKLCCRRESLPQGAPTSPTISNIHLYVFDEALSKFCSQRAIRYTRYADDLSFSFRKDQLPAEIIAFVEQTLLPLNLYLNEEKTKIFKPSQRQVITGVVVNEKVQLPRIYRKKIRQEIHYINKFGLSDHLKRTNNIKANYIQHLAGKISYALYVNPMDSEMLRFKKFIQRLKEE
jgi:RNA-directed DNA polymerase